MNAYTVQFNPKVLTEIARQVFDQDSTLKVMPSAFWQQYSQIDISAFCVLSGIYCVPTIELMAEIRELIDEVSPEAIEIGSGNGAIGKYLGIPATDSWQQTDPIIVELYRRMGQATVSYGRHVAKMGALDAIDHFKPKVVVGAWVTHQFNPDEAWRGGNQQGIDEHLLLSRVRRYIVIGHRVVHRDKPIMALPHQEILSPHLFSRSSNREAQTIFVWDNPNQEA